MSRLKELARVISEVELPGLTRRVRPHGFPKVDMSKYGDEGDEDERGEEEEEDYLPSFIRVDINIYVIMRNSLSVDKDRAVDYVNSLYRLVEDIELFLIKQYSEYDERIVEVDSDIGDDEYSVWVEDAGFHDRLISSEVERGIRPIIERGDFWVYKKGSKDKKELK